MTIDELIARLEAASGPERELDAAIVAELNNATVRRYPPTDDFGPRDRWQFWSRDGAHFLGSEGKFKVPAYTASLDAALSLVPEGWAFQLLYEPDATKGQQALVWPPGKSMPLSSAPTPALALCIASLRARRS